MTTVLFWLLVCWTFTSIICLVFALLLIFFFLTIFRDREFETIEFTFKFIWFDVWMGAFYDENRRILYFCPAPMCCFIFTLVPKRAPVDYHMSDGVG